MTKLRLLVGATAMLVPLAFSPVAASGDPLKTFQTTTPEFSPPLHGTNPHGEGTVAVVQLGSDPTRPYSSDPSGKSTPGNELLVVGRSRGEQRADGTYHGHITIAAVAGVDLLMVDTNPGETCSTDVPSVNCRTPFPLSLGTSSGLVGVLTGTSATSTTGSVNHFQVAGLNLAGATGLGAGAGAAASLLLGASAATSDGNITSDGTCQTATGASTVANATLGGTPLAKTIKASTISKACNNAPPTETDSSSVIPPDASLTGILATLPASGCATGGNPLPDGTPGGVANDPGKGKLGLVVADLICNSADQSPGVSTNSADGGQQATTPYGVREALDTFVLAVLGGSGLAKATTGAADSAANMPPCGPNQVGSPPNCTPAPCPAGTTGTQPNCTPVPCPAGTKGTSPNCVPNKTAAVCNSGGDNDCFPGKTTGASIPEGGPLDTSRDCREGVENTPKSKCPGNGGGGGGGGGATRSTLPFTGLDPLPIGILGVMLLGSGLALRRFSGLAD